MGLQYRFFIGRRYPELGRGVKTRETINYVNVPQICGTLISYKFATFHELDTVYSVEDAYDMLEIIAVDAANKPKEP